MSDIAAAERRLSAALDRIDYLLENGPGPRAAVPDPDPETAARLEQALARNAELMQELDDLRDAAAAPATEGDLGALQAEVAALRAERAAEIAQLAGIMAELERLVGDRAQGGADHG